MTRSTMKRRTITLFLFQLLGIGWLLNPAAFTGAHIGTAWADCGYNCWDVASMPGFSNLDNRVFATKALARNNVWAVAYYNQGNTSKTLTMHYNGQNWSVIPSPNLGAYSNHLVAVDAFSPEQVWAVGDYQNSPSDTYHMLALNWDGTRWIDASPPALNDGRSYQFLGVTVANNDIVCVGTYTDPGGEQQYIIWHYFGGRWDRQFIYNMPGTTSSLRAVVAVKQGDIWAVGKVLNKSTPQYETLVAHWDGEIWERISSPNVQMTTSNVLQGITLVNWNDIWAVGQSNVGVTSTTLIEHFNGSEWSIVPSPNADSNINELYSVASAYYEPNIVWAVGVYRFGPGYWRTLTMRWNGVQWRVADSPNPGSGNNYLRGVTVVPGTSICAGGDVWAVGYSGGLGNQIQALAMKYTYPSVCRP